MAIELLTLTNCAPESKVLDKTHVSKENKATRYGLSQFTNRDKIEAKRRNTKNIVKDKFFCDFDNPYVGYKSNLTIR